MLCYTCNDPILGDFIHCSGYCESVHHVKCTGISDPRVKEMESDTGLVWMCCDGRDFRRDGRNGLVAEIKLLLAKHSDSVLAHVEAAHSAIRDDFRAMLMERTPSNLHTHSAVHSQPPMDPVDMHSFVHQPTLLPPPPPILI